MSWEDHQQAVAAAIEAVQEFQTLVSVAGEKAEEAVGMVHNAAGNSQSAAAADALNQVTASRDALPELIGNLEAAKENLHVYGTQF